METQLSRLVDVLPGLVWIALPDDRAEFFNQRWCDYTGLSVEEASGHGWHAAIHPEDLAKVVGRWRDFLRTGRPGETEARLRRHDGVYRWFHFSAAPMTDESGRIVKWCGINTDIEDRVRAEEALRAREAQFRSIFDSMPVLVTLMTPEGELDQANRYFLDFFGASLEDLKAGWPNGASFHPDDFPAVLEAWRRSVDTAQPYDLEARRRRADGVYCWLRLRGFPLRDAQGRIVAWYSLQTDIDDAKAAEAKLAAEKGLLELVAMDVPTPFVLEELCRQVEDLAPGCYCSILLRDPDGDKFQVGAAPSLPASYAAILDGKAIDPAYAPSALAIALKAPVVVADLANDPRWANSALPALMAEQGLRSCWAIPVMSGAHEVLGVFAVYRCEPESPTANERELIDRFSRIAGITIERAQADAALQARETELRRAHDFLTEAQRLSRTGSFTWDVLADEHNWSDEIRRIFGFEAGTKVTLGMIRAAIHPEDLPAVETVIGRAVEGASFDIVFRIAGAGGAPRYAHVVAHRIEQITDRPVFIGALQDVTESKLAEEALNRSRDDLAHMARVTALSALTASIAHEVNQPLAGIITNASTCLRMLAADPPNLDGARATAQRTIRDGNRASEVIQRLRALFSRKAPASEPVDLNNAAGEVWALSSGDLQRRRVALRTDFAQDLPAVRGDRVQLQQVILNLILNAADAMSGLDDRPRELLLTTYQDEAGQVVLSVRDSGVGIEPQSIPRLFDTFYSTKPQGMGIGLSVSRSIIENHDGRIWATANDGPGATFAFSIPVRSEPAPAGEHAARTAEAKVAEQRLLRET